LRTGLAVATGPNQTHPQPRTELRFCGKMKEV